MEMKKYILYFLIILISISLFCYSIFIVRKKTMVNDLEEIMLPIKSSISLNSIISYKSNNPTYELYYRTQFVMAPIIVENNETNATILLVEDLNIQKPIDFSNANEYKTIQSYTNKKFKVLLLKKEK
jgi:hypothetical protein